MRNKLIRLSDSEHELLKVAQKLVAEKGFKSIKCDFCGWSPRIPNDISLGNIILTGTNLLLHWLQNPECLKAVKKERETVK